MDKVFILSIDDCANINCITGFILFKCRTCANPNAMRKHPRKSCRWRQFIARRSMVAVCFNRRHTTGNRIFLCGRCCHEIPIVVEGVTKDSKPLRAEKVVDIITDIDISK
jgi:hypothetical protein